MMWPPLPPPCRRRLKFCGRLAQGRCGAWCWLRDKRALRLKSKFKNQNAKLINLVDLSIAKISQKLKIFNLT